MAQQKGVPFCAIPRVPEDFTFWKERRVQAFVLGDERGIAYRALKAHLSSFKQEMINLKS
jgi:4-hydroxy-2-oxoheptanedioate aldolase